MCLWLCGLALSSGVRDRVASVRKVIHVRIDGSWTPPLTPVTDLGSMIGHDDWPVASSTILTTGIHKYIQHTPGEPDLIDHHGIL